MTSPRSGFRRTAIASWALAGIGAAGVAGASSLAYADTLKPVELPAAVQSEAPPAALPAPIETPAPDAGPTAAVRAPDVAPVVAPPAPAYTPAPANTPAPAYRR